METPKTKTARRPPTPKPSARRAGRRKEANGGKAPAGNRPSPAAALAGDVAQLRLLLKDVSDSVFSRLDAEAAAVLTALDEAAVPGDAPALPSAERIRVLRAAVADLKVKPRKGRVKDLGRLEAVLEVLTARLLP
ncbi:MAG: hypothetical protein AB1347_01185 [Acidobacteriota bacterium]